MSELFISAAVILSTIIVAVIGVRKSKAPPRSLSGIRFLTSVAVCLLSLLLGFILLFANPINWRDAWLSWPVIASNGAIVAFVVATIWISLRALWFRPNEKA